MLIDDALSTHCEVTELAGVPSPGTSAAPSLSASDTGVMLRYSSGPTGRRDVEVTFEDCLALSLGVPNDEALNGHRLWGRGLQYYAFQEVFSSDWIADMRQRNRAHHRHSEELFEGLRHFIVTFQDKTFECVAKGFTIAPAEQEGSP